MPRRRKANAPVHSWTVYELGFTKNAEGGNDDIWRADTLGLVELRDDFNTKELKKALIDLLGYHGHKGAPIVSFERHGNTAYGYDNGALTFELEKQQVRRNHGDE